MSNPFEAINLRLQNIENLLIDIKHKPNESPQSYTKQSFAEAIGRSVSFIDSERRAGRLDWFRQGNPETGNIRIPASQLEKYI